MIKGGLAAAAAFMALAPANAQTLMFDSISGYALGSYTFTQEFDDGGYSEVTSRRNFKGTSFFFENQGDPSIFIGGAAGVDGNDTSEFRETLNGEDYTLDGFVYSISNQGLRFSLDGKVRNGVLTSFSGTFSGGGQVGFSARFSTQGRISSNAAIPEPTTWAMMIGGFGLLGAAARRRTCTSVTYA